MFNRNDNIIIVITLVIILIAFGLLIYAHFTGVR